MLSHGAYYMIPNLKELNRLCQKPNYKSVGNWMVRHVERDLALPITWLFLHTNITANQVTAISLGVGIIGISLFAGFSSAYFMIGALLLQAWYLLDHVDGQIARYRGTASLSGRFFDFLTHHLIHGIIFFPLGLYVERIYGWSNAVNWGFATTLSMMIFNLINDTKYKTFFEALSRKNEFKMYLSETGGNLEISCVRGDNKNSLLRKAFSFCHKACEIHVLMNVLTLFAVLEVSLKIPSFDGRFLLFLFYGITVPIIAVTKATYLIVSKKIDKEFESMFKKVGA